MNDAGAVWWLTVQLWLGGLQVADGPYTEADCVRRGEAWDKTAVAYASRNHLKKRPGWMCFPGKPDGPDLVFVPPQLKVIS